MNIFALLRISSLATVLAIASSATSLFSTVLAETTRPLAILVNGNASQMEAVEIALKQLNAEIWQMPNSDFVQGGNSPTTIQLRSLDNPDTLFIIDGKSVLSNIPESRPLFLIGQEAGAQSIAKLVPLIERPIQLVALVNPPTNNSVAFSNAVSSQVGVFLNYFQLPNPASQNKLNLAEQFCEPNSGCYQFSGAGDRPSTQEWIQADIVEKFELALDSSPVAKPRISESAVANNAVPRANNDRFTLNANSKLTVPAPGFLDNDHDLDGDPLTSPTTVKQVQNGVLQVFTDGAFEYTPNPGFTGSDSFIYTVSDGKDTAQAEVTLSVVAGAETPKLAAQNDSFNVVANSVFSLEAPGILANDLNPENRQLQVPVYSYAGNNGEVVIFNGGALQYTPNPGFVGIDSFTYTASDGENRSQAQVTFNVAPANKN